MPLLDYQRSEETHVAVWQIIEDISYFKQKIHLSEEEHREIEHLKERKRLEWFASRYLLHLISTRSIRIPTVKDIFGKPFLHKHDYHISISHSGAYIAIIASPKVVGIDIQCFVPKITRIARKFLSEQEKSYCSNPSNEIENLHKIWCAKEAMYKAFGKKRLEFKDHIHLLDDPTDKIKANGTIQKDEIDIRYDVYFFNHPSYIVSYVSEK